MNFFKFCLKVSVYYFKCYVLITNFIKDRYMHLYRSHNCGEILPKNVGEVVKLSGWVDRKRDHGGLLFIDLEISLITSLVDKGTSSEMLYTPDDILLF